MADKNEINSVHRVRAAIYNIKISAWFSEEPQCKQFSSFPDYIVAVTD